MKITQSDALKVFKLNSNATYEEIKKAYRSACSKYHPDRNPAGLEMMKIINSSYQALSDYVSGSIKTNAYVDSDLDLGEELNAALNAIINLGLEIEICGSWIWVSGDTRAHKETLKKANFNWAPKKRMWHFRPAGKKSFSRGKYSIDHIRAVHGSISVRGAQYDRLENVSRTNGG